MQDSVTPRPNISAEELRRDFRASDPASRIRQGLRLSQFGSRLQRAMSNVKSPGSTSR